MEVEGWRSGFGVCCPVSVKREERKNGTSEIEIG